MSLQGSLRQLGLADLLQGPLAGRSGLLHLRNGANRAVLHVAEHQVGLLQPDPVDPGYLLAGFVHRGVLDAETVEGAHAKHKSSLAAVDALLISSALPRPELEAVLRAAAEDSILDLLTWQKGEFRFEEGVQVDEPKGLAGRVTVDLGGILLRAAQRFDEQSAIANRLGMEAHLFHAVGSPPPPESSDDVKPDIHALLDGERVVDEVALLVGKPRFQVLTGLLAYVERGWVRPASPTELEQAADARLQAGDVQTTRRLLLQWSGVEATNPAPLERLARLAREANHADEEADALVTLGHLHLQLGRPHDALELLRDLAARRPGDSRVLTALAASAEVAGDTDLHTRCTLQLAAEALKEDEPARAAQLLSRIVTLTGAPLAARVLRARALVRLRDREGLLAEAEAAAEQIGEAHRTREQREAAAYFRDAIATLAPERSDLLRRFRGRRAQAPRWRPVALAGALLALLATAAVVFWPRGPEDLLERARAAAAAGDELEFTRVLALLADEHPNAPETTEAFLLQAQFLRQHGSAPPPPAVTLEMRAELDELVAAATTALETVPAGEANAHLEALAHWLVEHPLPVLRTAALTRIEPDVDLALARLQRETRERVDAIGNTRNLERAEDLELGELRPLVEKALTFFADDYPARVRDLLKTLTRLRPEGWKEEVSRALRNLSRTCSRLEEVRGTHAKHVEACRLKLARLDLFAAYERCRAEASRSVVAGRFDEADVLYAALEERIRHAAEDPLLEPLQRVVRQRAMGQFVSERRAMIREIRRGLESAQAAETAGDLGTAVEAYADLARKFWHIRFESVILLPLRVETTPVGAVVSLNGKAVGPGPIVVRRAWGSQATLTAEAPGYETVTKLLDAAPDAALHQLHLGLEPRRLWDARLEPTVETPPADADGQVVLCERNGRIQVLDAEDGRVRWARHFETLEGIRARPVVTGGLLYLPFVDGTLVLLEAADGRPVGKMKVGRPVADPAVLGDLVAFPGLDERLWVLRGRSAAFDTALGGPATTPVVAAHGAFWVGTAEGSVVRVTPDGRAEPLALAGRRVAIVGLAPHEEGVLATRRDGTLHALGPAGAVRWRVDAIGDVAGAPAAASGVAATCDSRGRILLFDLQTGAPRGQIDLRTGNRHGLLAAQGLLVAQLGDGRLWAYDPARDATVVDVAFRVRPRLPAVHLGRGRIAVPTGPGTLSLHVLPPRGETKR